MVNIGLLLVVNILGLFPLSHAPTFLERAQQTSSADPPDSALVVLPFERAEAGALELPFLANILGFFFHPNLAPLVAEGEHLDMSIEGEQEEAVKVEIHVNDFVAQ